MDENPYQSPEAFGTSRHVQPDEPPNIDSASPSLSKLVGLHLLKFGCFILGAYSAVKAFEPAPFAFGLRVSLAVGAMTSVAGGFLLMYVFSKWRRKGRTMRPRDRAMHGAAYWIAVGAWLLWLGAYQMIVGSTLFLEVVMFLLGLASFALAACLLAQGRRQVSPPDN